jgi:hypothetical protein
MVDESIHNNPQDLVEKIFLRMEEKFDNVYCNMALLMVTLTNNIIPFGKVGGSNSEVKLGENEDLKKESRKEFEKEKPSSNVITPSQSLFKMEVKMDIKPYQGDIYVIKLNHWLQ